MTTFYRCEVNRELILEELTLEKYGHEKKLYSSQFGLYYRRNGKRVYLNYDLKSPGMYSTKPEPLENFIAAYEPTDEGPLYVMFLDEINHVQLWKEA